MHIERDGARLFFTTLGNGPDLVLLHPTPTRHEFWLPVAERLADRFRLILIDLRGHGQSSLVPETDSAASSRAITMEKLAEDTHAILAELGIAKAAFAGCSIGGYLLYEYWRRFPQEVAAMALVCGKPQPDTAMNLEKRQEWMTAAQQPGGLGEFFDLMADTLVGPTARERQPEVRASARRMMDAMPLTAMIGVQQGLAARPDSVPTLKTVRVPVCAIAGGEDHSSTPPEMRVVSEQVPGAEFHLLADAGHYAPLEQPEKIADILGNFFGRLQLSTATQFGQAGVSL